MFVRLATQGRVINLDHCVEFYAWNNDGHTVRFKMTNGREKSVSTIDAKACDEVISDILEALGRGDNFISI